MRQNRADRGVAITRFQSISPGRKLYASDVEARQHRHLSPCNSNRYYSIKHLSYRFVGSTDSASPIDYRSVYTEPPNDMVPYSLFKGDVVVQNITVQ